MSRPAKLYAMGLRQAVRRTTLADANERRYWRIWADFAAVLIRRATKLYAGEPLGLNRWQVELFFKWIKQHLRIKKFLGTSQNAVKSQIWCAICTYVLIGIIKKELHLNSSLYTCLQILSISVIVIFPVRWRNSLIFKRSGSSSLPC